MAARRGGLIARASGAAGDSRFRTALARSFVWLVVPFARPWAAGSAALLLYLFRASRNPNGLAHTRDNYFGFLADAFLHGQLNLRLQPHNDLDLVFYHGQTYLYWPPFPAVLFMPLVAFFGADVSDTLVTVVLGAVVVALLAVLFRALDRTGVAPLDAGRRALLVLTCAFGSVLLTLAPNASVWYTAQLIGFGGVLLATIAALTRRGWWGYLLVGLALAAAMATRLSLLFNGVWLAWYLFRRDYRSPRQWLGLALWAVAPVAVTLALLGWYDYARFGNPLDVGLAYHNMGESFRSDFARYGVFSLHYLPTNFYYQFLAYRLFAPDRWEGSGLFWLTPVFLGAFPALWRGRRDPLVWMLLLSCFLIYIPIGLLMGTGYFTFGPRYLLDLMVPLLVLVARGIRRWPLPVLTVLTALSIGTYALGSWLYLGVISR